jgi:hypothetical protein
MPGEGSSFSVFWTLEAGVEATTHIRNASNDPDSGADK